MTKKNRRSPSSRGFTLLEVLIAVLIVGIIAAAAIPMLSDYTEQAREARMVANVQALDRAVQRYELDHQAPWGFVYEPLSEDLYIPYNWEGGLGFVEQLEQPTDVYGNVMGEPGSSVTGPCVHGPYVSDAFAPAALLLGAKGTTHTFTDEGMVAILGSVEGDCRQPDWEVGVRIDHDLLFETGVPTIKPPPGTKHDERAAFFLLGRDVLENAYRFRSREEIERRRAARAEDRAQQIQRLNVVLAGRHPDKDEVHRLLIGIGEQLCDATAGERSGIVREIRHLFAPLNLDDPFTKEMIGTVVVPIKNMPSPGKVWKDLIITMGLPFTVGPKTDKDVTLVYDLIHHWQGAVSADIWKGELDESESQVGGIPIGDAEVVRRANIVFGRLLRGGDTDSRMDTGDAGLEEVVRTVVQKYAEGREYVGSEEEERLLDVERRRHVVEAFNKLKERLEELLAKGRGDEARDAIDEYIQGTQDSGMIRRFGDVFKSVPLVDLPKQLGLHSDELRLAYFEKAKRAYIDMVNLDFRNVAEKGWNLQGCVGMAPTNPGREIAPSAKGHGYHAKVGHLVRRPGTSLACDPHIDLGEITPISVAAARRRALEAADINKDGAVNAADVEALDRALANLRDLAK